MAVVAALARLAAPPEAELMAFRRPADALWAEAAAAALDAVLAAARAAGDVATPFAVGDKGGPHYGRLVALIVARGRRQHVRQESDARNLEAVAALEQFLAPGQEEAAALATADWYPPGVPRPPAVEEAARRREEADERARRSHAEAATWRGVTGRADGGDERADRSS
jgi:hypothetical protein